MSCALCSKKTAMAFVIQLSYWFCEHPEEAETQVANRFVPALPTHSIQDNYNRFRDVLQIW